MSLLVAQPSSVERFVKDVLSRHNDVHVLVDNARMGTAGVNTGPLEGTLTRIDCSMPEACSSHVLHGSDHVRHTFHMDEIWRYLVHRRCFLIHQNVDKDPEQGGV